MLLIHLLNVQSETLGVYFSPLRADTCVIGFGVPLKHVSNTNVDRRHWMAHTTSNKLRPFIFSSPRAVVKVSSEPSGRTKHTFTINISLRLNCRLV